MNDKEAGSPQTLGERIRKNRNTLSLRAYGKIIGVSAETVSNWEANRYKPGPVACAVLQARGVQISAKEIGQGNGPRKAPVMILVCCQECGVILTSRKCPEPGSCDVIYVTMCNCKQATEDSVKKLYCPVDWAKLMPVEKSDCLRCPRCEKVYRQEIKLVEVQR